MRPAAETTKLSINRGTEIHAKIILFVYFSPSSSSEEIHYYNCSCYQSCFHEMSIHAKDNNLLAMELRNSVFLSQCCSTVSETFLELGNHSTHPRGLVYLINPPVRVIEREYVFLACTVTHGGAATLYPTRSTSIASLAKKSGFKRKRNAMFMHSQLWNTGLPMIYCGS